jgi:hypothetical protein
MLVIVAKICEMSQEREREREWERGVEMVADCVSE